MNEYTTALALLSLQGSTSWGGWELDNTSGNFKDLEHAKSFVELCRDSLGLVATIDSGHNPITDALSHDVKVHLPDCDCITCFFNKHKGAA